MDKEEVLMTQIQKRYEEFDKRVSEDTQSKMPPCSCPMCQSQDE